MKKGFYFPHFEDARNDRKIKRLRKELGIEGYGIYFMILEVLRSQNNYRYPIKDIDLLADDFGTSEAKVKTTILNYDLFCIDNLNDFFSLKFIENMQPYENMIEQRREAGLKSAESRRLKAISLQKTEEPFNDRSTTVEQSKVKESKVNKNNIESECPAPDLILQLDKIEIPKQKIQNIDKIENAKIFYQNEITKNNNHLNSELMKIYKKIVDYLFGKNDLKIELKNILSMEHQLSFENFVTLMKKKPQTFQFQTSLLSIETTTKYHKDKKSIYLILSKWIDIELSNNKS